ncbi:MAG: MFS transporter [Gammaproteobacteria bacterium]|nr:MFS transporter [Gammaproteobacteria bacterium]
MTESTQADSTAASSYPAPAYGWYVVIILTVAYAVSFLDRQILALLVQPIKADLGITDTEMSLLLGLAFAIFYTVLAIPLGRMADQRSRRGMITIAITVWCLMTAACGLAKNFTYLFLARLGVGVGQAALNPAALSMISDYFPRERRGKPVAFYSLGISLGAGIAMLVGGQVISYVSKAPAVSLPLVGELAAWQTVLLWVGLPGLIIAVLMATVREPVRQDKIRLQDQVAEAQDGMSIGQVARFLLQRWRTYGTMFMGMSVVTIIGYAFMFWIPTMFVRTWGWTIPEISTAYGLVILFAGPTGVTLGGWLGDELYRRGYRDGHMRATLIGVLILIAASIAAPLMPTAEWTVAMLFPATAGAAMPSATGSASLMMIVPNQMRAVTAAMYYFVIGLLGLILGSTSVALVTDYVFADDAALRYSIVCVVIGAGILALGFLANNLKHFRDSVIEADQWSA